MRRPKLPQKILIAMAIVLFTTSLALAGTTGKITGLVTDAATGNPLPGVNIVLKDTYLGASTDLSGHYHILQIPPGTYTVVATFIGYRTISTKGVKVSIDLTTLLSFEMQPTILEAGEEVIVVAERTMIVKDLTSSAHHISADELVDLPGIGEVEDFVALQPGVVGEGENIMVRGGRPGELIYLIDGIPVNDPVYNTETLDIGRYAISEVEFQTGGFNAEYGGAQSGIVNVVTRTGTKQFTGRFAYFTDDYGSGKFVGYQLDDEYFASGARNFIDGAESDTIFNGKTEGEGLRKYSFNTDRFEFNSGGPEPLTTFLLPKLGVNFPGKGITYFVSVQANFSDGYTRVPNENYNNLDILPDGFTDSGYDDDGIPLGEYYIDTLATGNNPNIARYENLSPRKVNHPFTREFFGLNLGSRYSNRINSSASFDWRVSPSHRLTLRNNSSEASYDSYYHYMKFVPDHTPQWDRESSNLSLLWNHTLSNRTFYILSLSKFRNYELRYPGLKNGRKLLPTFLQDGDVPDDRVDRTPGSPTEGFYTKGYRQWLVYNEHENKIWTVKGDIISQVALHHELKTGLEIRYMDINHQEIQYGNRVTPGRITPGRWSERGIFRDFYHFFPTEGAVYFQDKIEYETLVVNAGLRYDYLVVGNQLNDKLTGATLPGTDTRVKHNLSPRLGISHPITDNDVLYFFYGEFTQQPDMFIRFQTDAQFGSAFKLLGNPDLTAEKTIAYEVGVDHAFSSTLKIGMTAFYKDLRDLIDVESRGTAPFDYTVYVNRDYGSARGFEFDFTKRYSNYVSGTLNYTLSWANGKSSSYRQGYDFAFNGLPIPIREWPLDWDQRHMITLNFNFTTPRESGTKLLIFPIPADFSLNTIWTYGSGLPFTPSESASDELFPDKTPNAARMPSTSNLDLRLRKGLKIGPVRYLTYLEIFNFFDKRNVRSVDSLTGTPLGDPDNIAPIDLNPRRWGPGRNVQFGIGLEW